MPLPQQTLVGNLTADPELRFTPAGKAVANFTVACSERRLNKTTEEWEDGDSMFVRCSVWEEVAEQVAESLVRGSSVIVTGALYQREYETKEGEKRYAVECRVRNIAAQITRSQRLNVTKVTRGGYDGGQSDAPPPDDPWGATSDPAGWSASTQPDRPPATAGSATAQRGFSDEPPF